MKSRCTFCMLMPTQRPCLPSPCPGSKILAGSTNFSTNHWHWRHSSAVDTRCLARLLVVGPTFNLCLHLCEAAKWCCSSFPAVDCVFCQNFIRPHFYNLELLVCHRFCEFIRASVRTCTFAWFQRHCDIFREFPGWWGLLSNGLVDALLSYKCQSVISPSKAICLSRPCYAWSS